MPENNNDTLRPDFLIVGMERSGTHWVAALLNAHPQISCFPSLPWRGDSGGNTVGEVHFFDTVASLYPEYQNRRHARPFGDFLTKYNKAFADLVPLKDSLPVDGLVRKLLQRYSDYCNTQRDNKEIVGESTPAYMLFLDLIDTLRPGIKKIASIRDPKDKIVSWHYNLIRKDKKPTGAPITDEFALGYLRERIIHEYEALLNYDGEVCVVTYEHLHEDTRAAAAGLVSFLGFEADAYVLSSMVSSADFSEQTKRDSGGAGRRQGEEDVKSGFRKGVVGDWKNNMSAKLAARIDEEISGVRNKVLDKYRVLG